MPYVDTVGNIVRSTSIFTYPRNQVQEVIWHWKLIAAGSADTRATLASTIKGWWETTYASVLPTTTTFKGVEIHMIVSIAKWAPVLSTSNTPGTGTGPMLPGNVRPILGLQTEFAGQAFRGRSYMPTPTVNTVDTQGVLTTALIDAINGMGIKCATGLTIAGSTWKWVLYHRLPEGDISAPSDDIANFSCTRKWGQQHRSGDYGKPNLSPIV